MRLNVWYLQSIIIIIVSIFAIILTKEKLIFAISSDSTVYYEFNKYLCTGKGFSDGNYWNKPSEFYFDILSFFYCADSYKDFIINSYYYSFTFFLIFVLVLSKKFGFIETIIFIIIFFLAINPNHLISQGRQLGALFLFFSGLIIMNNFKKNSFILCLFSFLAHNNSFIFSIGIYILLKLKKLFNFFFQNFFKIFLISLLLLIPLYLLTENLFIYVIKNGIYLFNIYGYEGFSNRLISSFSKYLFFVQLFTFLFIFILNVKSELIMYMAIYVNVVFLMTLMSMIFNLSFDMMIFRLLYPVKYIFVPLCFVYSYRIIIGKKCSI